MTYLFSGLGADKRVFVNLDLRGDYKFIEWTTPKINENLIDYANRIIIEQIDNQEDIKIIGVSFGGIIGIEVAKKLELKEITIISSVKTYKEIPKFYRLIGDLKIDKIIPAELLKWSNPLTNYIFGVTTIEDKRLLKEILKDTDSKFLKWAIRQIIEWRNEQKIEKTIHIHGTSDKILWHNCVKDVISIENGGHLMILNKTTEINKIIN
jgi:hypothetical protein